MKVGDQVGADLVHVAFLARGGFGTVSLVARQRGTFEHLYALKRPHAHLIDEHTRDTFLEEGRLAGLIHDASVVPVMDAGEDTFGPYLLMPYVEGLSLAKIIKETQSCGDLLPISVVLEVILQAARGLVAAHELRDNSDTPMPLVHRDVSPQNILVGFDGGVRIVDFGIAKVLSAGGDTTADVLKGKFGYMAPEQLQAERVTPQTDLYALGVVLFEALTCRRRHKTKDVVAIAHSIWNDPPPDVKEVRSDVPPLLDQLVFDMMATDPEERPASARDVVRRIRTIMRSLETDDAVELADFMAEEFAELRDQRRAEVACALNEARAAGKEGDVSAASPNEDKRAGRWMAAALVMTVAFAVALGVGVWSQSKADADLESSQVEPADVEPAHVEPANAEPNADPLEDNTPAEASQSMQGAQESEMTDGEEQDAESAAEESEPSSMSSMRRRRRRRPTRHQKLEMDWW